MNITQKVLCFQYGYWSLASTLEDIRRYCMNWYIVKFGGSQEEANDFFSYLCPRIIRSLYTYKFEGKSYLHYLKRLLHFQVKTYWKINKREQEKQEQIVSLLQDNYQVTYDGARRLLEPLRIYGLNLMDRLIKQQKTPLMTYTAVRLRRRSFKSEKLLQRLMRKKSNGQYTICPRGINISYYLHFRELLILKMILLPA